MSVSTIDVIIGRIQSATSESAIAVFSCDKANCLNAVFANTVASRKLISNGLNLDLVGVFDKTMDFVDVKHRLFQAALKSGKCNE